MRKPKRTFKLTENQKKSLEQTQKSTQDKRIEKICEALLLYAEGKDINYITNTTGASERSIIDYAAKYIINKEFWKKRHKPTNTSKLLYYEYEIGKDFRKSNITTYKEAATRVKELFDVDISSNRIGYFLRTHNFEKANGRYIKRHTEESVKRTINQMNDNNSYLWANRKAIASFYDEQFSKHTKDKNKIINMIKKEFPKIDDDILTLRKLLYDYAVYYEEDK